MNARMLPRFLALLGKIIVRYDVMADAVNFTNEELDLLRLARTEYDFYHAHERIEAGTSEGQHSIQESSPNAPIARAKLGLKTTR